MTNRCMDNIFDICIYIFCVTAFFGVPAMLAWMVVEGSKAMLP